MRKAFAILFLILTYAGFPSRAQDEIDKRTTLSLFAGMMNYQGDLNPHSFTFNHSQPAAGITVRKPLSRWFAARGSLITGRLTAADRWNREYLKPRNLSFTTAVTELTLALEVTLLNPANNRIVPYMYGGISHFHFNPWALDRSGTKTFLRPLSTEGQGIPEFPTQKPYPLFQWALPFGGGIRFQVNEDLAIGIDFSQRKTFTDYLDDVSSFYVDADILAQYRGQKAVEMAFRSDEVPNGQLNYPAHGEQRGTPTEMDWYYYLGLNIELSFDRVTGLFSGFGKGRVRGQGCPSF